jgi:hypothetical protein
MHRNDKNTNRNSCPLQLGLLAPVLIALLGLIGFGCTLSVPEDILDLDLGGGEEDDDVFMLYEAEDDDTYYEYVDFLEVLAPAISSPPADAIRHSDAHAYAVGVPMLLDDLDGDGEHQPPSGVDRAELWGVSSDSVLLYVDGDLGAMAAEQPVGLAILASDAFAPGSQDRIRDGPYCRRPPVLATTDSGLRRRMTASPQ